MNNDELKAIREQPKPHKLWIPSEANSRERNSGESRDASVSHGYTSET